MCHHVVYIVAYAAHHAPSALIEQQQFAQGF